MRTTIPILHSEVSGSGPVVVLLHGYMASSKYWQQVIEKIGRQHRIISLDLLGFGDSPKPACSRYDYDAQLRSIDATLDSLDVVEPFILVGHSMGALVALRYASTRKQRVCKLLLANMPIFLDSLTARREILNTNFFYYIGLRRGLHSFVWSLFRAATVLQLLPHSIGEGAAARRTYLFQSTAISRLRSLRNIIYAAKIEADLTALSITTTVLFGLHDRTGYIRGLPIIQKIEGGYITTPSIPGGHHLPLRSPELVAAYI